MLPAIEAIHSVRLSHEQECGCIVCRAAGGDEEALRYVMAEHAKGPALNEEQS